MSGARSPGLARRALALLVLGGTVAVLAASPAAGQSPPGGPAAATFPAPGDTPITLAAQDPWTPLGGDVALRLRITDPPPGGSVSFTAFQAFSTRKGFDDAVLGGPLASVLGQLSLTLDEIPTDERGARPVQLGLQSLTGPRDNRRLNIRRAGVYPLEVELRDIDEQAVASFRTVLVVGEAGRATVAEPLQVAWVWPLAAAPSFLPDGEPDRDVLASLRADGRLGRMALALRSAPDVPVTLAPTGETIEAWDHLAGTEPSAQATLDAVRATAADHAILDGPYVPIDMAALLDHGLEKALGEGLVRGSEVLQQEFGADLDRSTRVVRPASTAVIERLRQAGTDRVVVDSAALATESELRFTLAQPVTLRPAGTEPVTAFVTDPGIQALLAADLPAAQRVQLVLGALAVVALEAPSVLRALVLVNPDGFDAPTDFYTGLLTALRDNPYVRPVTLPAAFDAVAVDPPAPTVVARDATSERTLATTTSIEPSVSATEYRSQRTRLNAFGALTRAGDPAVGRADRALLASVSSAWPPDLGPVRGDAHLRVVDHAIDGFVGLIEVPDPRTITLTSRSGEIPLTFRNETGFPVRLRASLASEKLFFPEGSVLDFELPPKSTTVRVAVEARTSGTFPLDLEVTSTDGVLSISQRRLEVRSTFVSTVGIVLMVSAAVFLAVWWGFDFRRRHRHRRQAPTS